MSDTLTFKMLLNGVRKAYNVSGNWRHVGKQYAITAGMAYRIAHGYEPKDAHIRHTLGLPALVEIPPCKTCGGNHGMKRCPTTSKPRARRAISLTNPVSAAATIIRHMSRENVTRLRELLEI